tara:strand:+ start:11557 stop:14370 length:2814 start_codon:yes stop_codon:yes gene_type:complete
MSTNKLHSEKRIKAVDNITNGSQGDPILFETGDIVFDLTSNSFQKKVGALGAGSWTAIGGSSALAGAMTGHIIPDTNDSYDIGSAEYKIRDLYVSDSSLWVGDEHKIDIEGGSMKFKKRKKQTSPGVDYIPSGLDVSKRASLVGTVDVDRAKLMMNQHNGASPGEPDTSILTTADMRLEDWLRYANWPAGAPILDDLGVDVGGDPHVAFEDPSAVPPILPGEWKPNDLYRKEDVDDWDENRGSNEAPPADWNDVTNKPNIPDKLKDLSDVPTPNDQTDGGKVLKYIAEIKSHIELDGDGLGNMIRIVAVGFDGPAGDSVSVVFVDNSTHPPTASWNGSDTLTIDYHSGTSTINEIINVVVGETNMVLVQVIGSTTGNEVAYAGLAGTHSLANGASSGWTYTPMAGGGALGDLSDVSGAGPGNNDVLTWNQNSLSWEPQPGGPGAFLHDINDVAQPQSADNNKFLRYSAEQNGYVDVDMTGSGDVLRFTVHPSSGLSGNGTNGVVIVFQNTGQQLHPGTWDNTPPGEFAIQYDSSTTPGVGTSLQNMIDNVAGEVEATLQAGDPTAMIGSTDLSGPNTTNNYAPAGWRAEVVSGGSSPFGGASQNSAGTEGLVPAPPANEHTKFLQGDGNWADPPPPPPLSLDGLSNVNIDGSSLANGQVLSYDSTGTEWVNAAAGGISSLSDIPDVDTTGVQDGHTLVWSQNNGAWEAVGGGGGGGNNVISQDDSEVRVDDPGSGGEIKFKTNNIDRWRITSDGHILPEVHATGNSPYPGFDIGSAENKVRHLFLSSNSLWIGDDHKIDIDSTGKKKNRKRKKSEVSQTLYNLRDSHPKGGQHLHEILGGDPNTEENRKAAAQNEIRSMYGDKPMDQVTLSELIAYARSIDGQQNATITDIFNPDEQADWDEVIEDGEASRVVLRSPNGTEYELQVADDGTLSTVAL